jgi:hypothetical protein
MAEPREELEAWANGRFGDRPEEWSGLAEPGPIQIFGLPIALLSGFAITKMGFLAQILWYFVTVPLHETGHAVGSWLGSGFAFPIGAFLPMAGLTVMSDHRSASFGAAILLGLAALGAFAWNRRSGALILVSAALVFLWFRWTFVETDEEWRRFSIWAGMGGELFLSTFLVLLSFYDLPKILHWDFFRIFALFYGAFGFVSSATRWLRIRAGTERMPMGSFLTGGPDAAGDVERLVSAHGWTAARITRSYLDLAAFCAILIVAHWLHALSRRLRTSQR